MKTLSQLSQSLAAKECSSVELTQEVLSNIKNEKLNAFISCDEEHALSQAKAADEKRATGNAQPLCGIPIAQKDIFCTKGLKTTCASKMLENFTAPYDAHTIENFNNAGVVLAGKTNMDEFAMGSSNENSYFGAVKNPWNLDHIPGGSSGGSAAAVAAGIVPAATGTDTGGSIRQPASLCGITGLKPTYGRVSRYGMIAFASSLDCGGPFAQTAEDCALLLNVMAGHDSRDSTSINKEIPDYTNNLNKDIKGLRIGLPKSFFCDKLDSQIGDQIQSAIKIYESLGAELIEIDLPHNDIAVSAYYVLGPAEASANLSRFDGVRFGYRCDNPKNLDDLYERSRGEAFGDEVKRRIMMGAYALSSGYYDAYYKKAQQCRRLIANDYAKAFEKVDVIAGPTSPTTAFRMGEKCEDPVKMYLADIYTIGVNLAGLPGLSIPAGLVNGLPVGLQLISPHFEESHLLNIAHQFQMNSDFHQQRPEVSA